MEPLPDQHLAALEFERLQFCHAGRNEAENLVSLVEQATTIVRDRDAELEVLMERRRGPKGWEGRVLHCWHGGAKLRWVLADELQHGGQRTLGRAARCAALPS